MDVPRTMQIQEISAHPGPVPGHGTQRAVEVCKHIDVTTCIGCKACEVACVEWNDHPFRETTFNDTYQTMPSTEWNYWNLIKFVEHERDGNLMWLMRKDQCMHCEDPGCLRACPADGAITSTKAPRPNPAPSAQWSTAPSPKTGPAPTTPPGTKTSPSMTILRREAATDHN